MSAKPWRWPFVFAALLMIVLVPQLAPAQQQLTVQQPVFGIAIDASGVLSTKEFPDPTGKLMAKRAADARAALPGDILRRSDLRKVSLPTDRWWWD
jgi:hypothetical protein